MCVCVGGGGGGGVLMAIDQARCERSTHYRPRPKCLGNAF